MKKIFLTALLVVLSYAAALAEVVENYRMTFDNLTVTSKEEFAPQKWGRIVDPLEPSSYWGTETVYVDYSPMTNGGVDDGAYLKVSSQNLTNDDYDSKTANDLLITPAVSGKVSFYLKTSGYYSYPPASLRIYLCTKEGDAFKKGELFKEFNEIPEVWTQFTIEAVPENTYLGLRLDYTSIDEFVADKAEIELVKGMKLASSRMITESTLNANENNKCIVKFEVTVTNTGDLVLNPGDENFSVSILDNSAGKVVVATHQIQEILTPGQTSQAFEVTAEIDAGEDGFYHRFDIREDMSGETKYGGWVTAVAYRPKFSFCEGTSNEDISSTINFGLLRGEEVTKDFRVRNSGAAPMTITSVTLPLGYSTSVQTPFTVNPTSAVDFDLTLGIEEAGLMSGNVVFNIEGIGPKTYGVSGTVISPDNWFEDFENGIPSNMMVNSNWTVSNKPSVIGSDSDKHWMENSNVSEMTFLISPKLTVYENEKLTFFAAQRQQYSKLNVYYSSDRNNWNKVMEIGSDKENQFSPDKVGSGSYFDNFAFKQFVVENIPAGEWYIGFESGYARVNDIYGYRLAQVEHDMYISEFNLPKKGIAQKEYAAAITVRNMLAKAEAPENYQVKLIVDGKVVAIAESVEILAGESHSFDLKYVPDTSGEFTAYIEVLAGNYSIKTTEVAVSISEYVNLGVQVVGTSNGNNDKLPLHTFYKKSQSELIYTADQIGLPAGTSISRIAFSGYNTSKVFTSNVKMWIENTEDGRFVQVEGQEFTPRSTEEMTLVFDSPVVFEMGGSSEHPEEMLVAEFVEPFVYTGGNLRISMLADATEYGRVFYMCDNTVANGAYLRYNDNDINNGSWLLQEVMPVANLYYAKNTKVNGTVVDASSKEPILGAEVMLTFGTQVYKAVTNEAGVYTIDLKTDVRTYNIRVTASGHKAYVAEGLTLEGDELSAVEMAEFTDKREFSLTIKVVAPEGESLEGLAFVLQQKEFQLNYPESETVLSADGTCQLSAYGGTHRIIIEKTGLNAYEQEFIVDENEELIIELTEAVKKPFSLLASVRHDAFTGLNDVLFSWNKELPAFFDDFEEYEDFAITFGDWTGIDGDQLAAAALQGSYPNRGALQYAQIINPLTVEPAWWYSYEVLRPYSGQQYVGFVRTNAGSANDDWLISPMITVGNDNILRFMAKSGDVYKERFEVAVTTVENPTTDDFEIISAGNYETVGYETWETMAYDLSEYAGQDIKIAIHYISEANRGGAFMLMIDDFYVGQQNYDAAMLARRVVQRSPGNPNESFKVYLNDVEKAQTEDYSYLFEDLEAGDYKLGVKAIYRTAETEISELSISIKETDYSKVVFNITTNNETSADGLVVELLNMDTSEVMNVPVSEGKVVIPSLAKGSYAVNLTSEMFEPYNEKITVDGDKEFKIQLIEKIFAPFNIVADVSEPQADGTYDVILKWNQDLGFFDSFEEYDDFAVGSFGGWKSVDNDKVPVYPIALYTQDNIISFPGSSKPDDPKPIAPMVFNPYKTEPVMAPGDPAIVPTDGEKAVTFFSPMNYKADKWLVSPVQRISTGYVWTLKAKGYTQLPEIIEFCISTTNELDAFEVIDAVTLPYEYWENYEIDLSEYAGQEVYLAIHYISTDAFLAQVDEFYVGPSEDAPSYVGNVLNYEIYVNGKLKGTSEETSYNLTSMEAGEYIIGIKAVYKSGTSEMTEYKLMLSTVSGLENLGLPFVEVVGGREVIDVTVDAETNVRIFNIAGVLVEGGLFEVGKTRVDVIPGVYIVEVGGKAFKVTVR